jgi:hypothetical protein
MRYAALKTEKAAPTIEGDTSFTDMNMALDPAALQPGQYALAINKRPTSGKMETRLGTLTPVQANLHAFPEILGSNTYNNPNGEKVILIATATNVRMLREGRTPGTIALPAGTVLSGRLEFSQQFDKVLLHRGADAAVDTTTNMSKPAAARLTLVWDGKSPAGFVPIEKASGLTERALLPNADYAVNFGSRAVLAVGKDRVVASDLDEYSVADLPLNTFRVNAGTADPITGLYPMLNSQLIVGKTESIDVLNNFIGVLTAIVEEAIVTNVSVQLVSDSIGISARRTGKIFGDSLLWLNRRGFFRTLRTNDTAGRLYVPPTPIGAEPDPNNPRRMLDPLGPLIERINWPAAENAVAHAVTPFYFAAVPIDGSLVNNCVIVINTISMKPVAFDTWDAAAGFQIDNLLVADYLGQPALYAINHAGKAVHILYRGAVDELGYDRATGLHTSYAIRDRFESRAYATIRSDGKMQREFKRVVFGFSTWRPRITVTQLMEGLNDERVLTPNPIQKNPRKYYRWPMPDFDTRNVHDDFNVASREDYSVSLNPDGVSLGTTGIPLEMKQSRPEKFAIRARGGQVSYRVENAQGRADIESIVLESNDGGREVKRAA